jgi:phytoene dehydrogenase-like protein
VTVIEKNSHAGGRCSQFTRDGHRFDTGPTLLVMPRLYEQEFAELETTCTNAWICAESIQRTGSPSRMARRFR